jgi:endonuclease/exonuclease/phosphatase family metal-dependent hydrolase
MRSADHFRQNDSLGGLMAQFVRAGGRRLLMIGFTLVAMPLAFSLEPASAQLRLATWNIQTLTTGKSVFDDQPVRQPGDLEPLQSYARGIAADIIALQEVASPAAIGLIFPVAEWIICISGQFFESYPQLGVAPTAKCYSDGSLPDTPSTEPLAKQFNGFAFKKVLASEIAVADLPALGVLHRDPLISVERPVRWGLIAKVLLGEQQITLVNVHLKSGCQRDNPWRMKRDDPSFPNCHTLGEQVRPLTDIVRNLSVPFVVLGDFNRRLGPQDMLLLSLTGKRTKKTDDDIVLTVHTASASKICPIAPGSGRVDHFVLSEGVLGSELRLHGPEPDPRVDRINWGRVFGDHCVISLQISRGP